MVAGRRSELRARPTASRAGGCLRSCEIGGTTGGDATALGDAFAAGGLSVIGDVAACRRGRGIIELRRTAHSRGGLRREACSRDAVG